MSLSDCQVTEVNSFNGAYLPSPGLVDDTQIPVNKGRFSQNMEYFGGSATTRTGFGTAFSPGEAMSALINWLFLNAGSPANWVVWYNPATGNVRACSLASPTSVSTLMNTSSGAVTSYLMPYGALMYGSFLNANGLGVDGGQVYSTASGAADPLFAATMTVVPTMSGNGSGFTTITTPGQHNFGYIMMCRNGFITRPAPSPSDQFAPVSYTSDGSPLTITIAPAGNIWPSYVKFVAAIMSPVSNPSQYFIVPPATNWTFGSPFFFAPNLSGPTAFTVNVTDTYLQTACIDATPYFTELAQSVSGSTPVLKPSIITPYGQRVAYKTYDTSNFPVWYFSDSSAPQNLNAGTSGVYLPSNLDSVTGFSLGGVFYMLGPHWTYSTSDNGGVPATWANPKLVHSAIGSAGPLAVAVAASQDYAWVADEGGLYLFNGTYSNLPASYYQTADWNRINFAAPTTIQVVDDKTAKCVRVTAPLDGATSPSHTLTFDYSNGVTPDTIQYSLHSIQNYSLGSIAIVQNNSTRHMETWVGPSNSSMSVGRKMQLTEANPYRDFASGIDSAWETAIMPKGTQGILAMHHAARVRVKGGGSVQMTAYTLDHNKFAGPFSIPLQSAPGMEILKRFYAISEGASLKFEASGLDQWFQLSQLNHYWTPGPPQR